MHLDDGRRIWEAAILPTAAMNALNSGATSKPFRSLGIWLSRRAPGLRQLQAMDPSGTLANIPRTVPDQVSPSHICAP